MKKKAKKLKETFLYNQYGEKKKRDYSKREIKMV